MRDSSKEKFKMTGKSTNVLIPVDFSPKTDVAVKVGFHLAERLKKEVTLLHASVIPVAGLFPQFPDEYNGLDNENSEVEEVELEGIIYKDDKNNIDSLKKKIHSWQTSGVIPEISFESIVAPGMPEEVIADYCSVSDPEVVVMVTRGIRKKEEELIGSITVEVIDNCRVPIFTVPEDYIFEGFEKIVTLCAFCYLEGEDEKCIDALMKMFGNPAVKIYLFPAVDRTSSDKIKVKMDMLHKELSKSYPTSTFEIITPSAESLREEAKEMFTSDDIQMIIAPNKKRNIFKRFFKPGLPHRILFEKDIPMLAMPV